MVVLRKPRIFAPAKQPKTGAHQPKNCKTTMKTYKTLSETIKALKTIAAAWDIEFDTNLHTTDINIDIPFIKSELSDAKKYGYCGRYNLYWRALGIQHEKEGWEKQILMEMKVIYHPMDKYFAIHFNRCK